MDQCHGGRDKRDKRATPAFRLSFECMPPRRPVLAMARVCVNVIFLAWLVRWSGATEYKLCATGQHEALCKWIEASRDEIRCVRVTDSVDCLLKMQKREADFGSFYAEEAFMAARFLGDNAVVLAEVRHPDREEKSFGFETVAVVQKTLFGGLSALKGLSYCHPGFSKAQYWSDRVLKDFEKKVLDHFRDDIKCNGATRSAYEDDLYRLSRVFAKACRPGTWAVSDWLDKKLKRDYHTLCDQCDHPSACSYDVRNKGTHSEALRCLTTHGGNVTYTALEFVRQYFQLDSEENIFSPDHPNSSRYSFLCRDGSTQPLTSPSPCSWIKQPWPSVIALKSTNPGMHHNLKEWLGTDKNVAWTNHLRSILTRGEGVLKFREPLSVASYIKEGRAIPAEGDDSCRQPIRWCVIDPLEKKKCEYISTAAFIHGLPTRLHCVGANSKIGCLNKIKAREADLVYIDTDLGFISRKVYNLTASAYLETQRSANYYGVAVVKGNAIKSFKDLGAKRACFPQYNGLGWITYIQALKSHSLIPSRSCSSWKRAWSYLSHACAPGARDSAFGVHPEKVPDRLCKGCSNASEGSSCEAKPDNPYFGEIGALRCLDNGDGDVAFLDFHSIQKYLASVRGAGGATETKWKDFNILCRDGSFQSFNLSSPEKCSFIQVNGGEMVTRDDLDVVQKNDIYHTLLELDDLFGTTSRSYNPALRMFEPFDGATNVLFKESAVSLVSVYETQNSFVNNYVKLLNSLDDCVDDSASSTILPSLFAFTFAIIFIFYPQ